jgi:hypothetical protein
MAAPAAAKRIGLTVRSPPGTNQGMVPSLSRNPYKITETLTCPDGAVMGGLEISCMRAAATRQAPPVTRTTSRRRHGRPDRRCAAAAAGLFARRGRGQRHERKAGQGRTAMALLTRGAAPYDDRLREARPGGGWPCQFGQPRHGGRGCRWAMHTAVMPFTAGFTLFLEIPEKGTISHSASLVPLPAQLPK